MSIWLAICKEGLTGMTVCIEKINVILLIKASLFRRGVEQALSGIDLVSVSEISDISDVPYSSRSLSHGVAIVDIDLPLKNGFSLARQIKLRMPETGIIAFTAFYDDLMLFQILKAQASACLRKDVSASQLVETVIKVGRGQHPIRDNLLTRPNLADQVFRQFQQLFNDQVLKNTIGSLTEREKEILKLVAASYMNKQIAGELSISEQTVKNHITSILRKMGAKSRQEAVSLAKKQNLISI
jgi:DNA-binding NarL/FixJ family response regulator